MKLVFMGTPEFAVPSLRRLVGSGWRCLAVVTQPDRGRGRGRKITPTPVKREAEALGLEVLQPQKPTDPSFVSRLEELAPEVIVTVAYGEILPPLVLELPRAGCVNLHPSLLPMYRGAAPIHWAIINGEDTTGVTTMYMNEKMDAGEIILQRKTRISEKDNVKTLHDRLAVLGADLLEETLELIRRGEAPRVPQDDRLATYAPALQREHELVDWNRPARRVVDHIRGMDPWPGAHTFWNGKVLKVFRAEARTGVEPAAGQVQGQGEIPGKVVEVDPDQGFTVATADGGVLILEVQPAGRRRMPAQSFLRGYDLKPGEILGVRPQEGG